MKRLSARQLSILAHLAEEVMGDKDGDQLS